tara:strand:- start:1372 stop:1824 length:453 start_codon:yes stop_codon:yes gene_type:complete
MIDNPNKEELFISEHSKSQLEFISTDFRPMGEVVFSKRDLENLEINLEEFISIKGIKSLGNLLTIEKIKQVNHLESLPYDAPEIEQVEVIIEEIVENNLEELELEVPQIIKEVVIIEKSIPIIDENKIIPIIKPKINKVDDDDPGQITLF